LDSRNQESAQIPGFWNPMVKNTKIPGFWNPMVKNGVMGFFSDHKSSSTGSIPVSPAQIPGFWNPMVKNGVIGFFSNHKSSSTGSIPVSPNRHGSTNTNPNPMWGSIYDQRKIPLYHFLPLDSRNQESVQIPGLWNPMVKNVVMGFFSDHKSLIMKFHNVHSRTILEYVLWCTLEY
jgi:hypothetical protein